MPPRRRPPAAGASATAASSIAGGRPSKLAREHKITAREESEIREAWSLFSEPLDGEEDGVIPIGDVRRALIALGIPPSSPAQLAEFTAVLDPENEGFATYPAFLAICALQLNARRQQQEDERGAKGGGYDAAHAAELDEAYALFTGAPDAPAITLAHLRKVAALLRLDQDHQDGSGKDGTPAVTEELLRDMILEANGGAGVGRGVRKDEFDGVMRRAGVWR